ncbi:MAG: hypothetical protein KTR26_02170 [Flammeovirgaceae bacterium]|nr:hypothetical protein [Flammeovirgaceae bacterium]
MVEHLNYPNNLLKIETGQQVTQLRLFDDDGGIKPEYASVINRSIDKVLELNKKDENLYAVEFPVDIESKLDSRIRAKVTKELTGSDIRMFTSVLALAQLAIRNNELYFFEKTNQAYFEFTLDALYEYAGLKKSKHGNYSKEKKKMVDDALLRLHRKEFLVPHQYEDKEKKVSGFDIVPLLQIHGVENWEMKENRTKKQVYKLTVSGIFFNIHQKEKHTYFNLPGDLNAKLREINTGRPNVGIELFVKSLYQVIHCSKKPIVEYSHNRLIEIMKLRTHRKTRAEATIMKAFDTAEKLGIIKGYKREKSHRSLKYVIELNLNTFKEAS